MNMVMLFCVMALLTLLTEAISASSRLESRNSTQTSVTLSTTSMSLDHFQGILFTELHDEIDSLVNNLDPTEEQIFRRGLRNGKDSNKISDHSEAIWKGIVDHGWNSLPRLTKRSLRGDKSSEADSFINVKEFPFIVCNHSPSLKSGSQRLGPMIQDTGAHKDDVIIIFNGLDETCYHIAMRSEKASQLRSMKSNSYTILPMTDILKIAVNTFAEVSKDHWPPPSRTVSLSSSSSPAINPNDTKHITKTDDWERIIRVAFATGHRSEYNEDDVLAKASEIIDYVKRREDEGPSERSRNLTQAGKDDSNPKQTLSESFSLTSKVILNRKLQKLVDAPEGRRTFFQKSLKHGLEAIHGCETMIHEMKIVPQQDLKGFDIILNPLSHIEQGAPAYAESSASNVHCITSLIIALSTHPSIIHVEVDAPLTSDDFESQWITQSKETAYRPFTDVGLTGVNQIVSVIDSGCQVDHRYFGARDKNFYDTWDMSEEKIVSYDTTNGDLNDSHNGHGTFVAGVVAGNGGANDGANGIAVDAKLHIFDMKRGSSSYYNNPGPRQILTSMHNGGNGSKIANASWSTKFSAYSTACRMYDNYLYEDFQDVVFVASAGNDGRSNTSNRSQMRSIGNPAACKNTVAVGASLNETSDDRDENSYLADFSSRGPTADGRMKPDIIAPGFTVKSARAHPFINEPDTAAVFGTSYAAPIVSGNAALIHQYFEEGWFPCGTKECNTPIHPSGSLVKAVLMNGGQDLSRVQDVQSNNFLETLLPYDNSQGMGLVNLLSSLPVSGKNTISGVAQNNAIIADGERQYFFVRGTHDLSRCSSVDMSVTLAWYDQGAANGSVKALLNDLDVWVQEINWRGNVISGSKKRANNTSGDTDTTNNVERIRFPIKRNRRYRITVNASNLIKDHIKYSLIATGCFNKISNPKDGFE